MGGYGKDLPERSARPGLKSLRLGRKLIAGMVVTVEPGIYFNPALLKPALSNPKQKKFLVKSVIQEYLSFGGACKTRSCMYGAADAVLYTQRRAAERQRSN